MPTPTLPCWGAQENLSAVGDATGSIDTSAIPAAEADTCTIVVDS